MIRGRRGRVMRRGGGKVAGIGGRQVIAAAATGIGFVRDALETARAIRAGGVVMAGQAAGGRRRGQVDGNCQERRENVVFSVVQRLLRCRAIPACTP